MQVFSPIPFQEYNPDIVYNSDLPEPEQMDINKNYGHYDSMNTDLISFYATDYIAGNFTYVPDTAFASASRKSSLLILKLRSLLIPAREKIKDKLPVVTSDKDIDHFLPLMSAPTLASNSTGFLGNLVINKLYSLFVRASDVHILRAVEPSLRLRYRSVSCNETLTNISYCSDSQAQNLGWRGALARLLLEFQGSRQI